MTSRLDHLVYGVPDLREGVAAFAELTGVRPVPGGRHDGMGTANYLLGLGDGAYFEIIGPDPEADRPPRWFGLAELTEPRLLTWVLRADDLDVSRSSAIAAGYDPGEVRAMSRRTEVGETLSWRLTPDTVEREGGLLPFLIDWGATPHPSTRDLPSLRLLELTAFTPDPSLLTTRLTTLGAVAALAVRRADKPRLSCRLQTPAGVITL